MITFAGAVCPDGTIPADGSPLERKGIYTKLFAAIGTSAGAPDNTHFNVPNYSGAFLRGLDIGGGPLSDPDKLTRISQYPGGNTGAAVGSKQGQATALNGVHDTGHSHLLNVILLNNIAVGSAGQIVPTPTNGSPQPAGAIAAGTAALVGDNETRPPNVYVLYCIYY